MRAQSVAASHAASRAAAYHSALFRSALGVATEDGERIDNELELSGGAYHAATQASEEESDAEAFDDEASDTFHGAAQASQIAVATTTFQGVNLFELYARESLSAPLPDMIATACKGNVIPGCDVVTAAFAQLVRLRILCFAFAT